MTRQRGGIEGLSPDERAELAARCAADPAAATEFARRLAFEELLSQAVDPSRADFTGRLQRRLAGRRRLVPRLVGAALAIAAALVVAVFLVPRGGAAPVIGEVRGATLAGGAALAAGQPMPPGAEVRVDREGSLAFAGHGFTVRIAGEAVVRLDAGAGYHLRLDRGTVQATVSAPFRVVTTWGSADASAASFSVAAEAESTLIQVDSGTVRCRGRDAAEVVVGPGGTFTAGPIAAPGPAAGDHDAAMTWRVEPWGGAAELRMQSGDATGPVLHVVLPASDPGRPWTYLAHPLHVQPGDRYVRFRVRVLVAEPGSRIAVQLHMRGGPIVLMRDIALPPAGSGWSEVSTGLDWKPLKVLSGPDVPFDASAIDGLVVMPYGGVREFDLGDLRTTP